MSIDVSAKNIKLWKNEHEGRNGAWYTYSVSVSRKQPDGTYKNKGMRVMFPKDTYIPEELPNGSNCDIEGFLTLRTYESRGEEVSEIALFASKIVFKDYDSQFEEVDEDVPF